MSQRTFHTLFICTGNSARSIMAEALLNHHGAASGFHASSAGSHPKGQVHPWTLATLRENGLPTEAVRSKSWQEFAAPDAQALDFVFTVCDQAAGEVCPVWPGQPMTAHWGMPDPAAVTGSDDQIRRAFNDCFITLRRRIQLLLALPLATLERMAIQREINDLAHR